MRIIQILQIPPAERKPSDIDILVHEYRKISFFSILIEKKGND